MSRPALIGVNARLERQWGSAMTHTAVWPSAPLDPEELAAACVELVRRSDPESFVGRRAAVAAAAAGLSVSAHLDAHRSSFVDAVDAESREDLLNGMAGRPAALDELPFQVVVARRGLGLSHTHELGDGTVSASLLDSILQLYHDRARSVALPSTLPTGWDFLRGLLAVWLDRPRRVMRTVTSLARRRAVTPVTEPGVRHAPLVVTALVSAADARAIEEWRARHHPRPSASMVLLWLVARVLAEHGYGDRQHWQVMISMRRYSDALRLAGGNPVGRVLVEIGPESGPGTLTTHVGAVVDSGEVLVLHLIKIVKTLVLAGLTRLPLPASLGRRLSPEARTGRALAGSPGLAWSDRGPRAFPAGFAERVRHPDGEPPAVFTFCTPFQAGVNVNVNWVDGRPSLTLTVGSADHSDVGRITDELSTRLSAWLPE